MKYKQRIKNIQVRQISHSNNTKRHYYEGSNTKPTPTVHPSVHFLSHAVFALLTHLCLHHALPGIDKKASSLATESSLCFSAH